MIENSSSHSEKFQRDPEFKILQLIFIVTYDKIYRANPGQFHDNK